MKELPLIVERLSDPSLYPAALATLVTVEGSSYRRPGARLLLSHRGQKWGTISGGCLEDDVLLHAHEVIQKGHPKNVIYDTTAENDLIWGVGLGCHGVVRVFIERLTEQPRWADALATNFSRRTDTTLCVTYESADRASQTTSLGKTTARDSGDGVFIQVVTPVISLQVFGAGDDALPLVRFAKELGWRVSVVDPRIAHATRARFSQADTVLATPTATAASSVAFDEHTAAVIMTHHYVHDLPLLRTILPLPSFYVGLLGPKKRAEKLLQDLAEQGTTFTAEQTSRLRSPVGLDLGGDSPETVALAIVSEILAAHSGRGARPLRDRSMPIHQ